MNNDQLKNEFKIKQLNNVLNAIRNINRLITRRDTDPHSLLNKSLDILKTIHGVQSLWFISITDLGEFSSFSGRGFDSDEEQEKSIISNLKGKRFPICFLETMDSEDFHIVEPKSDCEECYLFHPKRIDNNLYGFPLKKRKTKYYGGIFLLASPEFEKESADLIQEVVDDLSFALDSIEKDKQIQMLSHSIENSPNLCLITNSDNRIEYVNKKFTEFTGYNLDEVQGKSPIILGSGLDIKKQYNEMISELKSGSNVWRGVLYNKKKGNEYYWAKMCASVIREKINTDVINNFVYEFYDISRSILLEDSLRSSEKRYRSLFYESPISLWEEDISEVKSFVDELRKKGVEEHDLQDYFNSHPADVEKCASLVKIIAVNRKTIELFEADNQEQLMNNLNDVFAEDSYEAFKTGMLLLLNGKKIFNFEKTNKTLRGREIYVNIGVSVLSGYEKSLKRVLVSILDITDKINAQQSLLNMRDELNDIVNERTLDLVEEKTRIETIIETIPEGILVLDSNGEKVLTNKAYESILKKIENDPKSSKTLLQIIFQLISTNDSGPKTIELVKGFHIEILSSEIKLKDETSSFGNVINIRDISLLMEYDKLRKQFVSMVSHELRTPITAINLSINNLQKYKDGLSDLQKDKNIDIVYKNTELLNQIIEDLLLISKLDSANITLNLMECDLAEIMGCVIDRLQPRLEASNLRVSFISKQIPVIADSRRLSQIFQILLDNAIKFSPTNSSIKVTCEEDCNQNSVIVKVIDNGRGIKIEELEHIFDRFHRAEDVRNKVKGTGLGLSIAKEFVELHGGKIFVESVYGKGSTFSVVLPKHPKKN